MHYIWLQSWPQMILYVTHSKLSIDYCLLYGWNADVHYVVTTHCKLTGNDTAELNNQGRI